MILVCGFKVADLVWLSHFAFISVHQCKVILSCRANDGNDMSDGDGGGTDGDGSEGDECKVNPSVNQEMNRERASE